ncbi:unnamed protein product [Cuscuta epithymum]|uniref:Uncharacterized protein n=1 Tax=Cuscuta epithymum TaxID=186058 RepID=A0AAV0C1U6_9ASTE|nr:unnamed protein product [Cuscuta epithymum]
MHAGKKTCWVCIPAQVSNQNNSHTPPQDCLATPPLTKFSHTLFHLSSSHRGQGKKKDYTLTLWLLTQRRRYTLNSYCPLVSRLTHTKEEVDSLILTGHKYMELKKMLS